MRVSRQTENWAERRYMPLVFYRLLRLSTTKPMRLDPLSAELRGREQFLLQRKRARTQGVRGDGSVRTGEVLEKMGYARLKHMNGIRWIRGWSLAFFLCGAFACSSGGGDPVACPGEGCACSGGSCECESGQNCEWSGGSQTLRCEEGSTCSGACDKSCTMTCAGADCDFDSGESTNHLCEAGSDCTVVAKKSSNVDCKSAKCQVTLDESSNVTCEGTSECEVTCTSSCNLSCSAESTCSLTCAGGEKKSIAGEGKCE